jgi:hypothetical protein
LPELLRLIRFAKIAALFAGALTIFCAFVIVGWQMTSFLKDGSWPALPLSSVVNMPGYRRDAIYLSASVNEIERNQLATVIDALLRIPAIVPLLLALVPLTAFYRWLTRTEKRHSEK